MPNSTPSKTAQLRAQLQASTLVIAPGCYDGFSARLVENAGFGVAYMTGFGVAGSLIGQPDTGLISFREMASQAENLANSINIPLLADADNGYGNALNTYRSVCTYARAGAAGIQIEDQVAPKRCGHTKDKQVIELGEMLQKIKAAKEAQAIQDIVLVARTDARAVNGFEDALKRCLAFEEAGADVIFFEAPESVDEMKEVCQRVKAPKLINLVEGGKTPCLPAKELEALGFAIAIYPSLLFTSASQAIKTQLEAFKQNPTFTPQPPRMSFEEVKTLVGFDDYYAREERLR